MITGYNTDVRHGEVVFHVQTEDKGLGNPYIESLVYVGGQVLASKRASYAELLAGGKDEKEIVALMDHQHRTMIAAIRHGKLDAKLASLAANRQTGAQPVFEKPAGGQTTGRTAVPVPPPVAAAPARPDVAETVARTGMASAPTAAVSAAAASAAVSGETVSRPAAVAATPETPAEPIVARPAPPAARAASPERTLDQVILEYLTSEADQEQLVLLLEEERDLALGARATLVLRASSSKSGQPVAGTQVSVRMISTVVEPRMLASGRTDERGVLAIGFDIPEVGRGTSALIINAVSNIGRAELKHLL
jgi:hypothetical protein